MTNTQDIDESIPAAPSTDVQQAIQPVLDRLDTITADIDKLSDDVGRSNERFSNYQQATQWVVQLAFTLIASATITVIITSVLKR